ncbi:hypothetical protein ACQJBY_072379 [Aegilops geniculata]
MFRFINAWLQAVFRYITAWLQAAAADDSDCVALPRAAMDFPVTVSLGPLHGPLHSFRATTNNLPDGLSEGQVRRLEEDLETLFTELKVVAEADDPSFTAGCWMKEVRELRYDAEDFFNEVPRSSAGAGRSALLSIILWIPSKLKQRRQAGEAFSVLRTRASDASQRRQSFHIGPTTTTIKPEFGQANVIHSNPQLLDLEESMDKLVKLMALDDQEIADLLAFDSEEAEEQVQVVPIFGSAGVGKTTLARTFYRNFSGKFQCQAFVRVSRNPDMRRMLSSMLSQIKAPPVHGFPDVQDLIDHIREYLQWRRYLIVIDDLWASSTWEVISRAFPDGDCCSRIIVTTEIEDVALACSRYQLKYMYEMNPLDGDQSRKLFLGRVFGSESGCPPDFKEVTYEITRKCGSLPLAIENIASMLACELDIDLWKHVQDSLPSVLSFRTSPGPEGLKEVLNIIYNNLSPYLKTCLLYLIMYPEGDTISKEDLVKQWVAEDLIGEGQDRERTARSYFDELVSRGMIQPVDRNYNDVVLTCTVHHMVLDLIRYKSLEENFIINVSCFQTTPGLPDKVRRLSVQFGGAKCANLPADFMMTQVRSLIFFGFLNCVPSFVEYKLLRVLFLHIWADGSKIFDLTRIGELFQLRYLKIDCNITVHLPDKIRQLKFLETLELHAPVNDMPSDISCLPLLRTLGYFDLSKNSVENVQSLGELNNLEDLHLTWSNIAEPDNMKNNMQCLGSILWKLSNLKSLTLVPAASHADVLEDAGGASVSVLSSLSSPPALLQRLELSGRCCIFSSLPEWTKELGNLCILKIAVRKLLREDIDILKGLPALMALSLYVCTAPVGKVVFDNEGFSVLKYFKFACAAPCMAFLKGAMPSVRELKLAFNANRMEQYPEVVPGLEYLIELREITAEVWGTGADESDKRYAESKLSGAIANHPCTPSPIVRVQCVDQILFGSFTQDQEHWTLEEQHEIQEELLGPLPEFLISTPSTPTQMRYGEQDEGRDRLVEVLTQEQEHWTLDPVPELPCTPSTPTQMRYGEQDEGRDRLVEVLTQEQEHWTLDPVPELPCTPSTPTQMRYGEQDEGRDRLVEVLTQEQEHWTLDPVPELPCTPSTPTQMRYGEQDEGRDRLVEVLTQEQEHWTLDHVPELPCTPSTPTQMRYGEQDEGRDRLVEVLTQEQEHWTLDHVPELPCTPSTPTQMRYGEQDEGRDRLVEVLTQEQEHWTLDHVPELPCTPSTPTQTRDGQALPTATSHRPESSGPAMGKAARWIRGFRGGGSGKKEQSKDQKPILPPNNAKWWRFGRSSRDSAEAAAAAAATSRLREQNKREQNKHAIAVAAATAAAADAAVAAAQAAVEIVRLTNKGRAADAGEHHGPSAAAVRIQAAFRGFLARKAMRALKAVVNLQALVRGYLVRKQAAATLQIMQALVRAQASIVANASLPQLQHSSFRPHRSLVNKWKDRWSKNKNTGL